MGEINRYTRQDLNALLYAKLKPLKTKINGGIYIDDERPNNSTKEDIVINTPKITIGAKGEMQKGYSNVNIYVPKLSVNASDGSQKMVYNKRSDIITKLVIEALSEYKCNGYLDIESEAEEGSVEYNEHFINLRLYWRIFKI